MLQRLYHFLVALSLSAVAAAAMDTEAIKSFHRAVQAGDVQIVRSMLVTDPALATSADEYGFQPIHLLDVYPEMEVLDLLLANGAKINAPNDEGVTILHLVTDPEMLRVLVEHGADIEARDWRGWTPLLMQANEQSNGTDVVAALLDQGADPNAIGLSGETALSFARATGNTALRNILVAHGARQ